MRLHVNIDHVATLRNARGTPYPDPVDAARCALDAGADGITAHLREDRRHIRDEDVTRLRATLRSTFNLEMAQTDEMVGIALAVLPDVVTFVPERREERTTEGGLDVVAGGRALEGRIARLREANIKVSLFIAPEEAQLRAARELGVEQVELHTGEYAEAFADDAAPSSRRSHTPIEPEAEAQLVRLASAAKLGQSLGLEVAAGHGLTVRNVRPLAQIKTIVELNIGHAIVSDAVFFGLGGAVGAMRDALGEGASP